ncbi:MAG TPA: methyltransferase domain-containing protein [Pyrinomonadaceae bacterium]|jgi:SAM-dependent methyltransferase|nr:methyltransferase domain-containing protein [Pyrinomonadaceae bacterium]
MFGSWSLSRIAWSLRKIRLPIKSGDLVLDVGSGSNPHPAADVLLERYLDPKHRYTTMVIDRPTVLADACKMPFRDKAFDFVIAFHVLEHVPDPAAFLRELQRVGKAGYIETPNAIFERLVPYDVHLLEIMNVNNKLIINKKKSAKPDSFLNELELVKKSAQWKRFFYGNPALFHVRYCWQDKINFEVLNPEVSSNWFVEPETAELEEQDLVTSNRPTGLRGLGLAGIRKWQRLRKRKLTNLRELLVCPECHGSLLMDDETGACSHCRVSYSLRPVPDFNRLVSTESSALARFA